MNNFIEEIKWRGMIHDIMPGTDEYLKSEKCVAYVGIDPTADSLHIGHLVSLMLLKHFQAAGHQPIVLVGGATGMIGDPSGKSNERNLLDYETLTYNQNALKLQISKLLNFDKAIPNHAIMLNNYDWISKLSFLDFIRDIGKYITVNYMMSKDSVKKRLGEDSSGLSFTEFSYQLVQGFDFLHLYKTHNCKLQMGGSDQWGNITTGNELIRRKLSSDAYALTCPLLTKSDGGKFGKTEQGNIWLDPKRTSPYLFYQFWLNVSDSDAEKQIKIFTMLSQNEVADIIEKHSISPHERLLQKTLAKEMMLLIHDEENLKIAIEATEILFGKGKFEDIEKWNDSTLEPIFDAIPKYFVKNEDLKLPINIINLVTEAAHIVKSKSEARRLAQSNALLVNKTKVNSEHSIDKQDFIKEKYLLIQTSKKSYHLVVISD